MSKQHHIIYLGIEFKLMKHSFELAMTKELHTHMVDETLYCAYDVKTTS